MRLSEDVNAIDTAFPMSVVGSYWLAPKYTDICPKNAEQVMTFDELVEKVGGLLK